MMVATMMASLEGGYNPSLALDRLVEAVKTVDVGLIKDDANPESLRKGTPVDLPPLSADVPIDIEQVEGEHTVDDTTHALPTEADVQAPPSISSGYASSTPRAPTPPGSVLIPVARVQKLET
uniref:Integrase core domain containing protein n=1 Tax=Solanum tuberosum TaxID=4113 RepID=M1DZJ9_SOLTU